MSSSRTKNKKPHGQVRQSQVVTTFGPGSMFDLPNHSVIVGGLDYWTKGDEVLEPRLVAKLKELLQIPTLALHAPPPDNEDPTSTQKTGITCWQFPEWFITQGALATESGRSTRSRRLIPRSSLSKGKFIDQNKKSQPVVPVRFVQGLPQGPHRRHRLVLLRPPGDDRLPPRPLDRRTRDQRRPVRGLGPLRVQGRAADHRGDQARHARPRPLRRLAALARASHLRAVRRAEPAAGPHGEQRLLPADDERHLAPRSGRGRGQGRRSGLGALPPVRRRPRRPDQGAEAQAARGRRAGGILRRGRLRGDPVPQAGHDSGARQVGQAGRVRDPGERQGGDRLGQARRRLLRPLPAEEALGPALDGRGRAGRPGPSAPRGDRDRRVHPLRVVVARRRRRAGDRRHAGPAGPRRLLAAGHRESGRGDLHPVQERGDRRLAGEARGEAARRAARWRASTAGRRTTTRASASSSGSPTSCSTRCRTC